jgi:tRNA threonylcarbamoyladenosine biosynthesis protein TsaE
MKYLSRSPHKTTDFGLRLAKKTKRGRIFALIGDLGGGKTVLTKGLAQGFGIKKLITSPTFILMKVYRVHHAEIKYFCHIDLYRLKKPGEIRDIGLHDFLGRSDSVVVIEWADKIQKFLAPYRQTIINFSVLGRNSRLITANKKAPSLKTGR